MSNTFKINVKYRKYSKGFDFDLLLNTNLKIFKWNEGKTNKIIKLGLGSGMIYVAKIFLLG